MKINHTKKQRADLLALARKLDRVPAKKFYMGQWVCRIEEISPGYVPLELGHKPSECGYAGCAVGWGLTMHRFREFTKQPSEILHHFGMESVHVEGPAKSLFGPHRTVGPRTVAADIRRYLKDGTLPCK